MIGSLRSSVAQLESEKYQLQKQVAEARAEARQLEDRLVDAEAHGQALARQLDDARKVVRNPGSSDPIDFPEPSIDDFPAPTPPPRRSLPASRTRGRKFPFAEIPGRIQPLPDDDPFAPEDDRDSGRYADPSELFPSQGGFGDQSRLDSARSGWLPVARGFDAAPNRLR